MIIYIEKPPNTESTVAISMIQSSLDDKMRAMLILNSQ